MNEQTSNHIRILYVLFIHPLNYSFYKNSFTSFLQINFYFTNVRTEVTCSFSENDFSLFLSCASKIYFSWKNVALKNSFSLFFIFIIINIDR